MIRRRPERRLTLPSPLAVYQGLSSALLAVMAAIAGSNLLLLARRRREPPSLPADPPRVSLLVPARDEAANIGRCLASLVAQDYPDFEVLALDDRSTDDTAAIITDLAARHPHLRALHGADLPLGWGGKAHACQQLADAASGVWLLFVDADTVHAPAMLRTAVGTALTDGVAVLTALPHERTKTLGERLLVPHLFFFLLALEPLPLLEWARFRPFVFVNGQFLLIRHDLYQRIGGHAAVRAQLMEDLALGVACKRAGADVRILDGADWVACRMYDGFGPAWRGFVRSLLAGSRLAPPYLLGIGTLTVLFFVGPFVVLIGLLLRGVRGRPLRLALGQVVLLLAIRASIGRQLRQSPLDLLLFPPGAVVLSAAAAVAVRRWLRGQPIEWRGRAYGQSRRW